VESRSAHLVEGVRLKEPLLLPPLRLSPLAPERGYGGRELLGAFNGELSDAGFATRIAPSAWAPQVAPRRRLALAVCQRLETAEASKAIQAHSLLVARLVDLLALTHGGAPREVGGVVEVAEPEGTWRTLAILAGQGPWPGSPLAQLATDQLAIGQLTLPELWRQPQRDPRAPVWLSLHRGIAGEPRWDVRLLRLVALLEAIAIETIPAGQAVVDRTGAQLFDYDGKPAGSTDARGRIYLLLDRCLAALHLADEPLRTQPEHSLWHEIGIWRDVRNAVAHEGRCPLPRSGAGTTRQRRVVAAFERAARGGSLDGGWLRYADTAAAAADLVLRAAVRGILAPS
jgi:hypothetical protein